MSGVYFVQGFDGGPIKIGRARDPHLRVRELQTGSPVPLDLLCTLPGGEVLEAGLHAAFAGSRLHGEWFAPTLGLESLIENLIAPDPSDPESVGLRARIAEAVAREVAKTAVPTASSTRRRSAPTSGG